MSSESPPKRHHYNPTYYLRRFESGERKLWRLDKSTGKIACGNSKTFGFKKFWNRLSAPPSGYDVNHFEFQIADIDSMSSRVIDLILNRKLPPSIAPLAAAISFMQYHQPRMKLELQTNHPEKTRGWSDDHFLVFGINAAIKNADDFLPKSFAILEIPLDRPEWRFLTSSNPIITYLNKPSMLLPISKRHCLLLNNDDQLASHGNGFLFAKDTAMIDGINQQAYSNSWQYVYADSSDLLEKYN